MRVEDMDSRNAEVDAGPAEGSQSGRRSWGGKGKQAVKRAGDAVKSATDTISGKGVAEKVDEFSEVYTKVLLGLHRDLEAQGQALEECRAEVEALKHQVAPVRALQLTAVAAIIVAALSMAIAAIALALT